MKHQKNKYFPVMPIEAQLLILCARTCVEREHIDQIKRLVQGNLNWAFLEELAKFHGVVPLVYRNLNQICPESVCKDTLDSLRRYTQASTLLNGLLAQELVLLLEAFSNEGISVIPFKGPTLAVTAYGDLSSREFVDLDLMVKQDSIPKARKILRLMGYSPKGKTSHSESPDMRNRRFHTLVKKNGMFRVDLQWLMANRYFSFQLDRDHLWKNLQSISVEGKMVKTLAPEDLLIILCVHGSKHVWEELKWICDVAELVRTQEGLDWETVLTRASEMQCQRMVLMGLFLAHILFDVKLPRPLLQKILADPDVPNLTKRVPFSLLANPNEGIEEKHCQAFYLSLKDTWKDQWQYGLHLCHTLSPVIKTPLSWFRLRRILLLLYYFVHPLHVITVNVLRSARVKNTVSSWLGDTA